VGALVLAAASWPWLFAVNLPLGALVLLGTRALPRVSGSGRKLDLVSAALSSWVLGSIVVGGELMPQGTTLALLLFAAAALAAIALVRREMVSPVPVIPLDLLRDGSFRSSVIASVSCFVGQGAAMVSLPFHLQHGFGQDALRTGLLITPWPLTVALVAPRAGRLADRVSGARLCALGGALLASGLGAMALWPASGGPLGLVPFLVLCGAGFGLFQVPNNRNMFSAAPRTRSGAAGGMQGTARLTGQTIGAVIMSVLFTATSIEVAPRIGLGTAAAATLMAAMVSMLRAPSKGASVREQGHRRR
jgi:DHA2 family multidrug resistance protein-like MFS transporter